MSKLLNEQPRPDLSPFTLAEVSTGLGLVSEKTDPLELAKQEATRLLFRSKLEIVRIATKNGDEEVLQAFFPATESRE